MVALAGIEAASDLAPDLAWRREDLRHVLRAGTLRRPVRLRRHVAGRADGAARRRRARRPRDGARDDLRGRTGAGGHRGLRARVALRRRSSGRSSRSPRSILLFAANVTMLGLSRHVYVLATNRQIPSWLGKLGGRRSTPHVAILIAAAFAIGLVLPGDVELLAGVFAFGAMLAISIAHLSLIRLRFTDPDRERPYSVPFGVRIRGTAVPLPALIGLLLTGVGLRLDRRPPRRRALGRRRLDALRAGLLLRLPPGRRGICR